MPKPLQPIRGAVVRLRYDVHLRSGKILRAGLRMTIGCTEGGMSLMVKVRSQWHWFVLKKKDAGRTFDVISNPPPKEEG